MYYSVYNYYYDMHVIRMNCMMSIIMFGRDTHVYIVHVIMAVYDHLIFRFWRNSLRVYNADATYIFIGHEHGCGAGMICFEFGERIR